MTNNVIAALNTSVASVFGNAGITDNNLADGITASYGIIGYRGKVWSFRYRGNTENLMRPDGDGPRNSVDFVILAAASHLSKTFYGRGRYVPDSHDRPLCQSVNGIKPDAGAQEPQSTLCATCPNNAWGSATDEKGNATRGKACKDNKRLAVVPAQDIANERWGGPMLLRVPPASLQNLAELGNKMKAAGIPLPAAVIQISFDPEEATPKLQFKGVRMLDEAEAKQVVALIKDEQVARILNEADTAAPAPQPVDEVDDQIAALTASKPAAAFSEPEPVATPKVTKPPKRDKVDAIIDLTGEIDEESTVKPEKPTTEEVDTELDRLLSFK